MKIYSWPKKVLTGQKHSQAQLTLEDVKQIRKSKLSSYKLAKKYFVSRPTIYRVKSFKYWK